MSEQTLTSSVSGDQAGFYGKIPSHGDFLSRRLPRSFIGPWETWLQEALTNSQEQLGEQWLDNYLTSPLWRFGLSPGICGDTGWAGVIMPSVDRVGRYYPLTLGVRLAPDHNLFLLLEQTDSWFARLEELALSCLEDGFELDQFDNQLRILGRPYSSQTSSEAKTPRPPAAKATLHNAWHMALPSQTSIATIYPRILPRLLRKTLFAYSLWWTQGSERIAPSLLLCQGLPHIQGSPALIDGLWSRYGWEEVQLQASAAGRSGEESAES